MNTDNTCSGKFVAGACPGPSTVQVGASNLRIWVLSGCTFGLRE